MAYDVSKVDVWAGEIEDRPGGLADKLDALSAIGANLEFVIARRAPERPGTAVVFVSPLTGAAQARAATAIGLQKAANMHSLRVDGADRRGLGARMMGALADAAINVRGVSAAALGKRCVTYFAFDSADDAKRAKRVLGAVLTGK